MTRLLAYFEWFNNVTPAPSDTLLHYNSDDGESDLSRKARYPQIHFSDVRSL